MIKEWKIYVNFQHAVAQELRESVVQELKNIFKNVEVKRRTGIAVLGIDKLEVHIYSGECDIYTDDIQSINTQKINSIIETLYKNVAVESIRVGRKRNIETENVVEMSNRLGKVFTNSILDDTLFLSHEFAKIYDEEIAIFNVGVNTGGYYLQIEVVGEKISDFNKNIKFLTNLYESKDVQDILNIRE